MAIAIEYIVVALVLFNEMKNRLKFSAYLELELK
jgi:hypothetical protein